MSHQADLVDAPVSQSVAAPQARVAVIIPTYNRGTLIFETLRRIYACAPRPDEIWIHVDKADGTLEAKLAQSYPEANVLTSKTRLGPGGGRHRCLMACNADYAVSFDDDSYPIDPDFFAVVRATMDARPRLAVLEAQIWQQEQEEIPRSNTLAKASGFTGCGHVMRVATYRSLPGYLSEPVPYNIEETDFAVQLFHANWEIEKTGELRVYHDTNLIHHKRPDIVAGTISNAALFAFINYPVIFWPYGALQVANTVAFCIRDGRRRGILTGLGEIPGKCYRHRHQRRPLRLRTLLRYLAARRAPA